MQNTHNTGDSHKYEKDDTPKKAFAGKSMQYSLLNRNVLRKHNTSYVQLSAKIAKLEKSNKKIKHANKKRKCKHDCDSNSNDSDSSRSDGSGSFGKIRNNCTRHNKNNTHVNTYPSLNKDVNNLDSNINSILINENIQVLWSNKDLKILKTMILWTN
jgi:hypothetical protein